MKKNKIVPKKDNTAILHLRAPSIIVLGLDSGGETMKH